jgi:hypothetical protein
VEAETVFEMLGFYPQLTWLIALEEFTEFSHHESFKSSEKLCLHFTQLLLIETIPVVLVDMNTVV